MPAERDVELITQHGAKRRFGNLEYDGSLERGDGVRERDSGARVRVAL